MIKAMILSILYFLKAFIILMIIYSFTVIAVVTWINYKSEKIRKEKEKHEDF